MLLNVGPKEMTEQEMRDALSNQLSIFRNWGYEQLAQHVEQGPFWKPHDCLEHVEAFATDALPVIDMLAAHKK